MIINNPVFGEMRKSLGGATFQRSASGRQIVRKRVTPINPRTNAQVGARAVMSSVSQRYTTLSTSQKNAWNVVANDAGTKYGRWSYVERGKWLATINANLAASVSGLSPATQAPLAIGTVLDTPANVIPDFTITSGTATKATWHLRNFSLTASNLQFGMTLELDDLTKNFTSAVNSRSAKLAFLVYLTVKKKRSRYKRCLVALSSVVFTPAASSVVISGVVPPYSLTDYKYQIQVGDLLFMDIYAYDPSANMARQRVYSGTILAS